MPNGRGGDFSSFERDPKRLAEEVFRKKKEREPNGGDASPDPEPLIEPHEEWHLTLLARCNAAMREVRKARRSDLRQRPGERRDLPVIGWMGPAVLKNGVERESDTAARVTCEPRPTLSDALMLNERKSRALAGKS
jgi:hypothetical protein